MDNQQSRSIGQSSQPPVLLYNNNNIISNLHVPPFPPTPPVPTFLNTHTPTSSSNSPTSTTSPAVSSTTFNGSTVTSPIEQEAGSSTSEHQRKKQKRNKPTLSCAECVERKTKCDRGRPHCIACTETARSLTNSRRMTKPPKRTGTSSTSSIVGLPKQAPNPGERPTSRASFASYGGLLSNVPYSHPKASNVFGIGSEHPFANYWTCQGGLPEVISVLPAKGQADILMERYFECVDPVYPMLHRQTFYADYQQLWSSQASQGPDKNLVDGPLVALIFAMMALGTQFISNTPPKEKQQSAEFYVSAAHQALRMSSYLSTTSMRSIQAMILITYFLINDNHASDGWAFAGILIRQAYAMGIHRDPGKVAKHLSVFEQQQRRKLWQAVLLQDTFLTVLLNLPPSATHTDVNVDDLVDDDDSIASCDPNDTAYIRGCWSLANLVQEYICSPRSLNLPISGTPRQKSRLVSDFKGVYRALPNVFRCWDYQTITLQALTNKRLVRQTLFLTSNYFHNMMLIHSSASDEVPQYVRGTLEAAHDAIQAFFLLYELFESEAKVWWVFAHRAFLESCEIGSILLEHGQDQDPEDQVFLRARADIVRMIQIMQRMGEGEHGSEVAATRAIMLREYL